MENKKNGEMVFTLPIRCGLVSNKRKCNGLNIILKLRKSLKLYIINKSIIHYIVIRVIIKFYYCTLSEITKCYYYCRVI